MLADHDVLQHRHLRKQPQFEVRITPSPAMRCGSHGNLGAVEEHVTRLRRCRAGDDVQQRGLARAIRPDQADNLARADIEGDLIQHGKPAVALRQPVKC